MTGHHIFTRFWYEYGSNVRNGGTFSVELTEGVFEPNINEVIKKRINPIYEKTQPSIAGYSQEHSLLRIFHPTTDSTVVSRSYYVDDKITDRGIVQYSFGIVYDKAENEHFLKNPARAFELTAFEPYDEFVTRVKPDGTLAYSNKYDPKTNKDSATESKSIIRENWVSFGFNKETFVNFFVSLGKVITAQKGEHKVALILPSGINSEALIHAVLSIIPQWYKRKFGAVSRWSGSMKGGDAAAIFNMQLVCYIATQPPNSTEDAIIDLTGDNMHRNISPITIEQRILAQWYWEHIDDDRGRDELFAKMEGLYKQIIDKMPFEIFAHCFWLWYVIEKTLKYKTEEVTFDVAAQAICSLASAFGIKIKDYFRNNLMLSTVFRIFRDKLDSNTVSNVDARTATALCVLADGDICVGEEFKTRDFIKPLYEKLLEIKSWKVLVPILQYYTKISRNEHPKDRIDEALSMFERTLNCSDRKSADEAALVLSKYANALVASTLSKGEETLEERYKMIALMLKKAGRQINIDVTSFENVPKNEKTSKSFYTIEKFNREEIANLGPPGNKQLDAVVNGLQWLPQEKVDAALSDLLSLYWQSDEIKDVEIKRKYIHYLRENKKIYLFVKYNVGLEDIRKIYEQELDAAFDKNEIVKNGITSVDNLIIALNEWFLKIIDCGFSNKDVIFAVFYSKFELLGDVNNLCAKMSPNKATLLIDMLESSNDPMFLKEVNMLYRFDEIVEAGDNFSLTFKLWQDSQEQYRLKLYAERMDYWIARKQVISVEWALSRAIIEGKVFASKFDTGASASKSHANKIAAQLLKRLSVEEPKSKLNILYEALHIIIIDNPYNDEVREEVCISLCKCAVEIVKTHDIDILVDTADTFKRLRQSQFGQRNIYAAEYVVELGKYMCKKIKDAYKERNALPPEDVLRKFNPNERIEIASNSYTNNTLLDSFVTVGLIAILILSLLCCALLFMTDNGILRTLLLLMPVWLIIVMAVSALLTIVLSITNALMKHINREG